jgi:hypothetical protein
VPVRNQQWLFTLLPAFPLILLVLRLFYLSRQNLQTMLLLVQYVSPLGLVSALMITLVWAGPVVVLVARALGALHRVSVPGETRSWLARTSLRVPDWVVALAALLAALTWQLRFLPALLMLALAIVGLEVRDRRPDRPRLVRAVCLGVPLAAAVAGYAWLAPAIGQAWRAGEQVTAALLLLPPALTVLLTGPVPAPVARYVTHWPAVGAALLAPFVVGGIFLRAPILPTVAMEVTPAGGRADAPVTVLRGHVITVDDRMTTLLEAAGTVRFVRNDAVLSQTLCPDSDDVPTGTVAVRGWHAEQTALEWLAPAPARTPLDPRCQGRPLGTG